MDHSMHAHAKHDMGPGGEGECVFFHHMVFHAGVCQEILFPGWRTTSALQVFGSAVALFVAGVLYEGLKYYREVLHKGAASNEKDSQVNIARSECGNKGPCAQTVIKYTIWSSGHIIQTMFHMLQTTISYILMLVFMTYNVWLCLGLVAGMGLGYFLFGWKKSTIVDANEHCQ